jgi:hypothetical protein
MNNDYDGNLIFSVNMFVSYQEIPADVEENSKEENEEHLLWLKKVSKPCRQ